MVPLSEDEQQRMLGDLVGWEIRDGFLCHTFVFEGFAETFGFMSSVALVAESMDHHPDWSNVYNRVVVQLQTHDAGGLTEVDFTLALRISELASHAS